MSMTFEISTCKLAKVSSKILSTKKKYFFVELCYAKPKYGEKAKFWYMGTDSLIVHIKTDDICKRYWTRFDTWSYVLNK